MEPPKYIIKFPKYITRFFKKQLSLFKLGANKLHIMTSKDRFLEVNGADLLFPQIILN